MQIGYIGLGTMGGALARRLLTAYPLTVWDLNQAAVAAFEKEGAQSAPDAAALARGCDIILLCLPRSSDVRRLIFGANGLAEGLSAGKIVIDQSSGTPAETLEMAQQLAQRGVAMLDAPVSGNPMVFAAGRGTVMVSGPNETYDKAAPLLRVLSDKLLRCGQGLGDAQAMKLVNNTINSGCRLAALEAAALGRKMGMSLETVISEIGVGAAANSTTRVMLPALLENKSSTNFALALMLKDLNQSIGLGMAYGAPMPIAATVRGLLQVGVNTLGQDARLEEVVQLVETMAGTRIAGPSTTSPSVAITPAQAAAIHHALAACNTVVSYEAFAMGLKFGLSLENLCQVINASSGWNGVSSRLWPAPGPHAPDIPLAAMVGHLQMTCQMAIACGAPMPIANGARNIFEAGVERLNGSAASDTVAQVFEAWAGVRLTAG